MEDQTQKGRYISDEEYQEYLFYKKFIGKMNAVMYVMDQDPYKLSWICDNKTVARILGISAKEVLAMGDYITAHLLADPDFEESVSIPVEKFKENPDINWAGVYRIAAQDGSHKWIMYSASTLEANDQGVPTKACVVAVLLDDIFNTPETLRQLKDYIKGRINMKEIESLTDKQRMVLQLLGRGLSRTAIADTLDISVYTVDDHKKAIGKKFDLQTSAQLVKLSQRLGLK